MSDFITEPKIELKKSTFDEDSQDPPSFQPIEDLKAPSQESDDNYEEEEYNSADRKKEIITNEILIHLIDDMMMDGFVLREVLKLQGDAPKGIKTNINIVKTYLTTLSEFVSGNHHLLT